MSVPWCQLSLCCSVYQLTLATVPQFLQRKICALQIDNLLIRPKATVWALIIIKPVYLSRWTLLPQGLP